MKASNQVMEGRDWIFSCRQFFKDWPDVICSSAGKESTCNASDHGSIPGSGRSPGKGIGCPLQYSWAFLVAQKEDSACSVGDLGSISGLGRSPGGRHSNPFQYSCLENPHGQKSLAGYSPRGHKESDTTEQLSTNWHHLSSALAKLNWKEQLEWKLK